MINRLTITSLESGSIYSTLNLTNSNLFPNSIIYNYYTLISNVESKIFNSSFSI